MPDHTWRHRHVNVENKKRAQEGKEPFPKYGRKYDKEGNRIPGEGQGWDQKSQDDGSWQPSGNDEIYEDLEKRHPKLKGKLTWPKPKIHPDDVAPEDKYRNALTIANAALKARQLLRIGPALSGFLKASLGIRGY